MKRLEAVALPGRGRAARRRRLRARTRSSSRATSARERWPRTACATSSTRGSSPAPRGSPAPTRSTTTSSTWSAGGTSPRTARSRPPRCGPATRPPTAAAPLEAARGIEIGHIFQLGRKFADAFGLDALGPDGKPIRITMGSYGIGVSRLVARDRRAEPRRAGLIWPRERRAVRRPRGHRRQVRRDHRRRGAAGRGARRGRGCGSCSTTARRSPGVKFADAELVGVPTIVVVGRGLATAWSRSRTGAAASAPRCRWTAPSHNSPIWCESSSDRLWRVGAAHDLLCPCDVGRCEGTGMRERP